jgi:hypothetical protein
MKKTRKIKAIRLGGGTKWKDINPIIVKFRKENIPI